MELEIIEEQFKMQIDKTKIIQAIKNLITIEVIEQTIIITIEITEVNIRKIKIDQVIKINIKK